MQKLVSTLKIKFIFTAIETLKLNKMKEAWIEQLLPIIEEFKNGDDSPLDGDSVDVLIKIIKAKINLQEGNITEKEYSQILG